MTHEEQLDALQSLMDHPGWKVYDAHVEREWGAGGVRFEGQLNKIADSTVEDVLALRQIQQIAVARREILKLRTWPTEEVSRLKRLREPAPEPTLRPFSQELVGQSRRGGL